MNKQVEINLFSSRILIVDDEPLIRKVLKKYLVEKKYSVDVAENGAIALDQLRKLDYDLVLTDLKMPQMGGRELLRLMSEEFPTIPKIVLTGYGTNEDIIVALKAGAYDFLTKPISDFKILEYSVERAIERKKLNDERTRYIEQLQQINEVISMLNSGLDTESVFKKLNVILKKTIPFNRFSFVSYDDSTEQVQVKLVHSESPVFLDTGVAFNLQDSIFLDSYKSKSVLNIKQLENFAENKSSRICLSSLLKEGINSLLILPMIVNGNLRGFLIFGSIYENVFNDEHIVFLESIVGQISLSIQRGELLNTIEEHNKNLEQLVELRTKQIVKTQKTTVFALSKLAETRDPETGSHLERIRNYSVFLGQLLKYDDEQLNLSNNFLRDLYDSSILHDIGKVGIPDGILLKDGFLSGDEFEIMKKHTIIGYEALHSASKDLGANSFLEMAMDVALCHHEQWDGKGYPNGLVGDQIPLSARIVSIVDVYDALTSKRPYKEKFSHLQSLSMMKEEKNKFDPKLMDLFFQNNEEFDKIRKKFQDK